MKVKLWGVRGSLPTPMQSDELRQKFIKALTLGQEKLKVPGVSPSAVLESLPRELQSVIGGATTCVEVKSGEHQLILDMGTGARKLGVDMMENGFNKNMNILFTHTHWDHIQGWPFFVPGHQPESTVNFYSCLENLEERMTHQQKPEYTRFSFADTPSRKNFHYIPSGGSVEVGPFTITTQKLLHPGGSISYKIQADGKTFIFATDTEFYGPDLSNLIQQYKGFFQEADLMIMDAQYSLTEAEQKQGWGHTAMTIAVDCCIHWHIKELILTHHEPAHSDEKIYELYAKAADYLQVSNARGKLRIHLAREGDAYEL